MINKESKSITLTGKIPVSGISDNLDIHLIQITEDKLRNILIENKQVLERRSEWIAPLGILVTLLITITTTTPNDSLGLTGPVWQALFILSSAIAIYKTGKAFINRPKESTIDSIVDRIKNVQGNR